MANFTCTSGTERFQSDLLPQIWPNKKIFGEWRFGWTENFSIFSRTIVVRLSCSTSFPVGISRNLRHCLNWLQKWTGSIAFTYGSIILSYKHTFNKTKIGCWKCCMHAIIHTEGKRLFYFGFYFMLSPVSSD